MASHPRDRLRLLTINTWKCDGAYHQRMAHLARGLRDLRPDVICCQEVFQGRAGDPHTGRYLADRLGLQVHSLALRRKSRRLEDAWIDSYSGLGILTAWTMVKHSAVRLPTLPEDGDRYALFAVLRSARQTVLVINTHLSHLSDAVNLRIAQLETILSQPEMRAGYVAVFLCGDFNAEPHSPEIQYLLQHPDVTATDMLSHLPEAGSLVTFPTPVRPARDRPSPEGRRIDHVFRIRASRQTPRVTGGRPAAVRTRAVRTPEVRTPEIHIPEARIVLEQPSASGIYASDHFGVLIETTLTVGDR
ncbi:MAG: endonuclease/exonuclease/phosphatase family protein [Desulfosarcinaceae bacterium]|nr:endonuclease/exonuclease/phosphatase family protein [Desulfosarcinaceae bacterium]